MTKMTYDRSDKDNKYFIDDAIYNCPFCKRRHVKYKLLKYGMFDSSNSKKTYYYIVQCEDCGKKSFHLSKYELHVQTHYNEFEEKFHKFIYPLREKVESTNSQAGRDISQELLNDENIPMEMDDIFFYHMPSSFFTIDERIPNDIRKPLCEANNCLNNNFLIGASAALRKAVYKLLKNQNIPEVSDSEEEKYIKHVDRVDLLKEKLSNIDSELIDNLKEIHTLTSQELHENDWKDFDGHTIRFLIGVVVEILIEIYINPDEKSKRREHLKKLKSSARLKAKQ